MRESEATGGAARYLWVDLAEGVRGLHMSSFYLACFMGIMLTTFVPQMQPYLLTEALGIPQDEHGAISGDLSFWGEVAIVIAVLFWGPLSDKVGRRPVMAAAFALAALSLILYPRADSYAGLMLARIVFAVGIAAYSCMAITLIADYARPNSRGKATGLHSLANALGALVTVFLLLRLPAMLQGSGMDSMQAGIGTYNLVCSVALITTLCMWWGLKPSERASREASPGFATLLREGFAAARHPPIALSYGAAFVARGNLAIVGTFMTLWLANHGTFEMGMSRADAMARAGIVLGVTNLAVLIAAPLFGILTDRINYITALMIALGFAAAGYGGTWLIDNPLGGGMFLCAAVIGIGEVGCIVTSGVVIAQESPRRIRGAVIGFFNLCGALGIMVAAKLGGMLFDTWREAAPFIVFGGLALVVLLWAAIVRFGTAAGERPAAAADGDGASS